MDSTHAPLPTTTDGYIDEEAAAESLTRHRIWDDIDAVSDIDSIDGDSDHSDESSTSSRDIQQEWDENVDQLRQLASLVIFPYVGRWIGKKTSYWVWTRYLQHHFKFRSIGP